MSPYTHQFFSYLKQVLLVFFIPSSVLHPFLSVNLTVDCLTSVGAFPQCLEELGSSQSNPLAISATHTFHSAVDEEGVLHF